MDGELAIFTWARNWWERDRLRARVERLERIAPFAKRIIENAKRLNAEVIEENRKLGTQVTTLEEQNGELQRIVETYEASTRVIDPNAKCPCCGHRKGHLTHEVSPGREQVRPVNNCEVCGFRFLSGPPVAGEELAAQLHQPSLSAPPPGSFNIT